MLCYHFGYSNQTGARRGKRLRPRLVLAVAGEAGANANRALDAAVAVELLHNYSLVHDDIEDGDRYRHGRQTLWAKYGVPQAVNAGDALCALSILALLRAQIHHPPDRVNKMVTCLHQAHLAMCEGQSLDLAFESQADVPPEDYLEMIAGKTAALFGAACELGALCGGLDEASTRRFRDLGIAFGTAFQIYDDTLGVWADQADTGKTPGADLARRKKSYPVLWALATAPRAERERIASAYAGSENLAPEAVNELIAVLGSVGAREAAKHAAAKHLAVVERAPAGPVRDFLLSLLPVAPAGETVRS